ncbi:MAG: RraA family protein [Planctomycetes bacterium]|nr:RraA family protein [Planctomycetota bacterium]
MTAPRRCRVSTAAAIVAAAFVLSLGSPAHAGGKEKAMDELRAGKNFIPTPVHTEEEDQQVLKLFAGLRVADVCDGMDKAGLQDLGLVAPDIRPLWRDTKEFKHRIAGIAVTARYVPTNKPPIGRLEAEAFDRAAGAWYGQLSPEPFVPLLRKGSVLVIEGTEGAEAGTIGSNNILGWVAKGCVGVVTNATARDTDEIAAQGVPLYFRHPGRGIRPGRNEIESVNRPVVIGGVTVIPGDVVVADGDGVIIVPRRAAEEVALYARKVLEGDKAGRRRLYERLGLPPDESVK